MVLTVSILTATLLSLIRILTAITGTRRKGSAGSSMMRLEGNELMGDFQAHFVASVAGDDRFGKEDGGV